LKKKSSSRGDNSVRDSRTLIVKIPESIEKTADSKLRENIIADATDAMLGALNIKINKDDLTFEEALHASDLVYLSIIAKYINFIIDMKFEELLEKAGRENKERRMYA
jgi:hypothetical protein